MAVAVAVAVVGEVVVEVVVIGCAGEAIDCVVGGGAPPSPLPSCLELSAGSKGICKLGTNCSAVIKK